MLCLLFCHGRNDSDFRHCTEAVCCHCCVWIYKDCCCDGIYKTNTRSSDDLPGINVDEIEEASARLYGSPKLRRNKSVQDSQEQHENGDTHLIAHPMVEYNIYLSPGTCTNTNKMHLRDTVKETNNISRRETCIYPTIPDSFYRNNQTSETISGLAAEINRKSFSSHSNESSVARPPSYTQSEFECEASLGIGKFKQHFHESTMNERNESNLNQRSILVNRRNCVADCLDVKYATSDHVHWTPTTSNHVHWSPTTRSDVYHAEYSHFTNNTQTQEHARTSPIPITEIASMVRESAILTPPFDSKYEDCQF